MKKDIVIISTFSAVIIVCGLLFFWNTAGNTETNHTSIPAAGSETAGQKSQEQPQADHTVVLEKAGLDRLRRNTRYPGTVNACKESRLAFRVGGPLVKVNIQAGDLVKKGDILMQIDPQDFKDRINVLDAQLSGALSQLETAKQDFDRMEELFGQKVIPQADFDHARNGKNTAWASVKQIRAQLAMAKHQLEYTSLKAPYDGIITRQMIENYEMVSPGQVVVDLHDISMLEILVNVPENEIIHHPLKSGEPAWAAFPSLGDKKFSVNLKEWSTAADMASHTYKITFIMNQPEYALILPGMTAEIDWSAENSEDSVMTVPAKAIITDGSGESYIWVFDPGTSSAFKKSVIPGTLFGKSRIIIKKGLNEGDMIVIDGGDFITEGMKLNAVLKNNTYIKDNRQRPIQ